MADLRKTALASYAAFLFAAGGAVAGDDHDHEGHAGEHRSDHRAHDAHIHGTWELFAALDGRQLSLTVKGPIFDLVGFEHAPSSTAEREAFQDAQDRLGAPGTLFSLDGRAKCALREPAAIALPDGFADAFDDERNNADHRGHNGEGAHDDHNVHASDVEVSYIFECQSPSRLRTILVTGFDAFPAIENVDAVFLSDAKQAAQRLTRGAHTLTLD